MGGAGDKRGVVIAGAVRTPFGRFGGTLREITLPALGAIAVRGALERAGVAPAEVDELAVGVNFPGADRSVARQIGLRAGIPEERSSFTIDRACCSSLSAVTLASRGLRLGDTEIAVAGGAENLSLVPYFIPAARFGQGIGDIVLKDVLVVSCPHTGAPRAVQASNEAARFGVSREEQDAWAYRSQMRWRDAQAAGRFVDELVPVDDAVEGARVALSTDESPRPDTTLQRLAQLRPVNGSATVTAGNAPGLSTGASALVLMAATVAAASGTRPLAALVTTAMASGHPQGLGSMPAVAARLALTRAGLRLDDMTLIEINEAFAVVPLVSTLVLADGDRAGAERLRDRTNVNGGAIAVGHPTGATAGRLLMTAAYELRRRGGGHALVTICGGIGEAEAAIIRVD